MINNYAPVEVDDVFRMHAALGRLLDTMRGRMPGAWTPTWRSDAEDEVKKTSRLLRTDGSPWNVNGRVARLLTGAMLSEHGYTVGRYVSLEQAIAESDDAYYQALLDSTHGWHDGAADPWPWLGYFTSVIAGAYAVFADRAAAAQTSGTKQQRVREHILRHAPATFRLADIRTALPGVSDQTIRLALEQLRNEGRVRADGTGRSATWTRTNTASSE